MFFQSNVYITEQNRTEQNRTEQNRTEQKRTEQNIHLFKLKHKQLIVYNIYNQTTYMKTMAMSLSDNNKQNISL